MIIIASILTIGTILLTLFALQQILKGDPHLKDKLEQARQQRKALAEQRTKEDPERFSRPV